MAKQLEIDYVRIKDVNWGDETKLEDGFLTVNKAEILDLMSNELFSSLDVQLVKPGENCRILAIMDCMQPRCKADHPENSYPGIWGKMAPAGEGRTVALKGLLVSDIVYTKMNIKYYLDMGGETARYSNFSRHFHLCIEARPADGVTDAKYEEALKHASLSLNVFLAKLAIGVKPDEVKVYENKPVDPAKKLPRVAYLVTHMASNDTLNIIYYGQSMLNFLPMVVQPTDVLDGAVLWRYWDPNYFMQEEGYIKELLDRNGKDLDFAGVVFCNNVMKIDGKDTQGMIAAEICKETLGADCVLINKDGMGHCQLDSAFAFDWCEDMGMPCVMNLSAVSNDEPGDMLVISDQRVDAVINSGRNFNLEHPRVDRLIGEEAGVPSLLGLDPWGPFKHTTNFAYQGIWSQLGDCYVTTDADIARKEG